MAVPYFFSMINPGTVVMGTLFLTFLSILAYILSKVFRDKYGNVSTVTVGIVSFCASTLIVFFGKDTIYNIVEGLRFSNTILYVLSGIAVLVLLYLFRRRLRFCMLLMLIGAGLILIGALTDWFYQKWFVILFGVILFLLGAWLCRRPLDERKAGRWRDAGYKMGYGLAKGTNNIRKAGRRTRNFEYGAGMRRGGNKSTRSRFVGKAATERYARRFGNKAARKRFNKLK